MQLASRRTITGIVGMAVACLMAGAPANGQTGQTPRSQAPAAPNPPAAQSTRAPGRPAAKPLMSEDVFKNIQVLKGIPVDEFMGTMGFFAASLGLNCLDCHVTNYAQDTSMKITARKMILMVRTINRANFGGSRMVTCYTCHHYDTVPDITPSLLEQYGEPPPTDPNNIGIFGPPAPGAPSADQILDRYIAALGGAERVASLRSFVAKGMYEGFDTNFGTVAAEIFAKAPDQRTTIVHPIAGDSTTTYDGRNGWIAATNTQLKLAALTGGELDGARLDAQMSFPAGIKQYLNKWRTGFPPISIDDHDVQVVQGIAPGGSSVKLYFDKESGLLVRLVRFTNTVVGFIPAQIDYSDYRDVAGVKMPFKWTSTWTDGKSSFEITDVQPNVPIDAAKFNKPAPPAPKPTSP
jgi:photosynthetic reaction center cytochrome c subunit